MFSEQFTVLGMGHTAVNKAKFLTPWVFRFGVSGVGCSMQTNTSCVKWWQVSTKLWRDIQEYCGEVAILCSVVREDLPNKVIFEQRSDHPKRGSNQSMWGGRKQKALWQNWGWQEQQGAIPAGVEWGRGKWLKRKSVGEKGDRILQTLKHLNLSKMESYQGVFSRGETGCDLTFWKTLYQHNVINTVVGKCGRKDASSNTLKAMQEADKHGFSKDDCDRDGEMLGSGCNLKIKASRILLRN